MERSQTAKAAQPSAARSRATPSPATALPRQRIGEALGYRELQRLTDAQHREADAAPAAASSRAAAVQRRCAACEDELQREATEEEELTLAPAQDALREHTDTNHTEAYLGGIGGRGAPLPESARRYMEPRFGVSFSRVRVHTDEEAHRSAQEMGALAYTSGTDIVFRAGHYDPYGDSGRRLLAHELTHVVQQGGAAPAPSRQAKLSVSAPDDPLEQEAEHVADEILRMPAPVQMPPGTRKAEPVAQRYPLARRVLMRDDEEVAANPQAAVTLSVSLDGLVFDFGSLTYREGHTRNQMMALILRRLLGTEYRTGLETQVVAEWEAQARAHNYTLINDLDTARTARANERVGSRRLTGPGALLLVDLLERTRHLDVQLTDTQRELLVLGVAATSAWADIRGTFPPWYTEFMFRREMAQHAALLRAWRDAERAEDPAAARGGVFGQLLAALGPSIDVLEAIRVDFALANERPRETDGVLERRNREDGPIAYLSLWNLQARAGRELQQAPPETGPVNEGLALLFLAFVRTQPALADVAADPDNHDTRLELLARFKRFALRVVSGTTGDERLLNQPARANAPAWSAELTSTPPLTPPLYDAALETDHAFTMHLQWGHWTDAFALYAYRFEFIRVPDPGRGHTEPPDLSVAAGQRPSFGTVLDTRLARASRYNATDVERVRHRLGDTPWGHSAEDLVHVNNALRTVGTVIHTFLDRATEPDYVARFVFPRAGMYVVRCRAIPVLEGDEEIVRLPSVAFVPVVARDPDEIAVSRVRESTRAEFDARVRIAEIQALLSGPFPPENAAALRQELDELHAILTEPGEALAHRARTLDERIALLERRIALRERIETLERATPPDAERIAAARRELGAAGGEAGSNLFDERELRDLSSQRDAVRHIIDTRRANLEDETGTRFVPHATFVSDLGASIELALEMYDRGVVDNEYQVNILDLTTPDSGRALGTAPVAGSRDPRADAILAGLVELLETSSDYGRGRIAINIAGTIYTRRVEAGTGRLLSEALESSTMVLSLAAIAAAPFTEGASLYLLLPLGAIGAVPSAYRLYQRYDENRLRFDLAAAMDVVNVVGGFLGLAQVATPLRMVRLGRVLMVIGIGADASGILLMGAGVVAQLAELQNLPEHERAARMLEILGNAMLQIGIQAGAAVMHARYQEHRTAAAPREETRVPPPGEETPGFHPPADPAAATARETVPPASAAERTAAGAGPPPTGAPPPPAPPPPAPPPPARPAAASPERLFELLGRGVERTLPPPPPAGEVARPPPAGEFRRGLRTADAAYHAYNEALAVSAGREVAIFHDPSTGEYRVIIGDETGVRAPDRAGWNALVHYHPNPTGTLTFRLPAPADFNALLFRFFAEGALVREFIEFDIPGVGRGRTEYGIDPANPEPYYVRIHQPDGTTQTLRFAHDGAYRTYWGDRTVYVEPGSPQYESMIRDIQEYVRSLGRDDEGGFGSRAPRTESGDTRGVHPPPEGASGRTAAGAGSPATPTTALQTGLGELTDAGVAFIRGRYRTATDRAGRRVQLDTLTDAQIRELFPNRPNWLEAIVVAEARAGWIGRNTTTDFVLANPTQTLDQVGTRLSRAVAAGGTGHSVNTTILRQNVVDFVRSLLAAHDPVLEPAYNACEHHPDPQIRRRWQEFKTSTVAGDLSGFFIGRVGSKRPDIVEVLLSQSEIHVTDASFAYQDPIHNFKSAFYRAVLERMIAGVTVTATDYRAPLRQTPVAP